MSMPIVKKIFPLTSLIMVLLLSAPASATTSTVSPVTEGNLFYCPSHFEKVTAHQKKQCIKAAGNSTEQKQKCESKHFPFNGTYTKDDGKIKCVYGWFSPNFIITTRLDTNFALKPQLHGENTNWNITGAGTYGCLSYQVGKTSNCAFVVENPLSD